MVPSYHPLSQEREKEGLVGWAGWQYSEALGLASLPVHQSSTSHVTQNAGAVVGGQTKEREERARLQTSARFLFSLLLLTTQVRGLSANLITS